MHAWNRQQIPDGTVNAPCRAAPLHSQNLCIRALMVTQDMKGHEHTHGHSRAAKQYSVATVTCNNDATSFANAVLLEGGKLHGGPYEAKQDGHDDEAPQPLHKLLHLHNCAGVSKAHTDVILVGGKYDVLTLLLHGCNSSYQQQDRTVL